MDQGFYTNIVDVTELEESMFLFKRGQLVRSNVSKFPEPPKYAYVLILRQVKVQETLTLRSYRAYVLCNLKYKTTHTVGQNEAERLFGPI